VCRLGAGGNSCSRACSIASADPLQLSARRRERDPEHLLLVRGAGDPGDRPNLRVRGPPARKDVVDLRQPAERPGDPDLLPRRGGIDPRPPRQLVRTALRPLPIPAVSLVKSPNTGQQSVGRDIEASRNASNLIAQFVAIKSWCRQMVGRFFNQRTIANGV
jgi:hypothetical protein